jgi:simple sugar transport system ATP-binding protein
MALQGAVKGGGGRGVDAVRGLDLEVKGGEILGIAGISGNGQRELAEAVSGLRPAKRGRVEIDGQAVGLNHPKVVRMATLCHGGG